MVQMEQDRELERQKVAQHRDVLVTTWQSQVQLREAEAVKFPCLGAERERGGERERGPDRHTVTVARRVG